MSTLHSQHYFYLFFLLKEFENLRKGYNFATPKSEANGFTIALKCCLGVYQSGQMGQTVNLLVYAYGGSNPSAPTVYVRVILVLPGQE